MDKKLQNFISERKELFWYISEKDLSSISYDIIVEIILNYGSLKDFIKLISLMGIDNVADIFYKINNISDRRKGNMPPMLVNFFDLIFKNYAYRNTKS